jgi:hypothetical protein
VFEHFSVIQKSFSSLKINMQVLVYVAVALVACASAAPDKRPSSPYRSAPPPQRQQYSAPPPPPQYPAQEQQQYSAPAEQSYEPAPAAPEEQSYPAPQEAYPAPAPKQSYAPAPKPTYSKPPTYQPKPKYQPARAPAYVAAPSQQYVPAAQTQVNSYAPKKVIAILSQDFNLDDYGYKFNYQSEDYQQKEETAKIIPGTQRQGKYGETEEDDGSLQVQGSYSYTAPDGTPISLRYEADENGFRPSGAHLPVAPELPQALVDAIAQHQAAVAEAQQRASYQPAPQSYQQPQASYQQPQYTQYQQQPAQQQQYYQQ